MFLMSDLEQKARQISFHPRTTLIVGDNDTGKSSILKSIYRTFGAQPAQLHDDWKHAEVTSLVRFSIDNVRYSLLRKEEFYALFDSNDHVIGTFHSVTKEWGPAFAEIVKFKLQLLSRENELTIPPPAYFFLPYYVDQDKGWNDNWASFSNLSQFGDYRRSVAEYHAGVRPNEYYVAKGALKIVEAALEEVNRELRIVGDVRKRMQGSIKPAEFNVSLEEFRTEVDQLLKECQGLLELEQELKGQMEKKASAVAQLEAQIHIVLHALNEVSADFKFVTEALENESVDCPTCGAQYSNSFVERFEIAKDEERLQTLALKLKAELQNAGIELSGVRKLFDDNHAEVQKVRFLLDRRRADVSLGMVLQSEGRKEVEGAFQREVEEIQKRKTGLEEKVASYGEDLKRLSDRNRTEEIHNTYLSFMRLYLEKLSVERLSEESYKRIDSRIKESGSDQPRALLAYYFTILQLVQRNPSATMCPIVIDSPNQQDQDPANLKRMLEFIRDNRPADTQLVLAVVDRMGVEFDGAVVDVRTKNSVLEESSYAEVSQQLRPLIAAALEHGTS